jgi:hypothetical protein
MRREPRKKYKKPKRTREEKGKVGERERARIILPHRPRTLTIPKSFLLLFITLQVCGREMGPGGAVLSGSWGGESGNRLLSVPVSPKAARLSPPFPLRDVSQRAVAVMAGCVPFVSRSALFSFPCLNDAVGSRPQMPHDGQGIAFSVSLVLILPFFLFLVPSLLRGGCSVPSPSTAGSPSYPQSPVAKSSSSRSWEPLGPRRSRAWTVLGLAPGPRDPRLSYLWFGAMDLAAKRLAWRGFLLRAWCLGHRGQRARATDFVCGVVGARLPPVAYLLDESR